jgi:hypothetical protein
MGPPCLIRLYHQSKNFLFQLRPNNTAFDEDSKKNKSGRLKIVPNDYLREGVVDYTFYENGFIHFRGYVTYVLFAGSTETFTESFDRTYTADPKTLLSETYRKIGSKHQDFKLMGEVREVNGDNSVVHTTVKESPDVTAEIEVDTLGKFMHVAYAEVKGTVLGKELSIVVKDY